MGRLEVEWGRLEFIVVEGKMGKNGPVLSPTDLVRILCFLPKFSEGNFMIFECVAGVRDWEKKDILFILILCMVRYWLS